MPENFRSSFHGFNREDVVHYLDYLNKKHDEMLSQLSSEADSLRQKLENAMQTPSENTDALKQRCDQLESALAAAEAEKAALEGQVSELQEKLAQAQEDLQAAQAENQSLENRISALQAELDGAQAVQEEEKSPAASQSAQEQELEAYRRAERTERMARERADQVYRQVNGVLADATVKVEEAAGQLADISDRVMSQLDLLRSAVDGSKRALADAAAGLYDLKPTEE